MTKLFAFYLPQFHQVPENDIWWGEGFTEWTNVKKAKPLFLGHDQPIYPAELGYYDLVTSDIMHRQAQMARSFGVNGFVFYHYWFGDGKTLLEKPILNFLNDKSIDIEFCICWANESWKGTWHGASSKRMLQEQLYLGKEDYQKHFYFLLPFFKDSRSLKIDGEPVYQVYVPESIPDWDAYKKTFDTLAKEEGLKGIYWIAVKSSNSFEPIQFKINGIVNQNLVNINKYHKKNLKGLLYRYGFSNPIIRKIFKWPKRIPFSIIRNCLEDFKENYQSDFFPLAIPNWDNTPRTKENGTVYTDCFPQAFKKHLQACINQANKNIEIDKKIVFIKSWNEWAEGNILEPEVKNGFGYLEAIKTTKRGMI